MIDLVVLDVGNSTATVALFAGERVLERRSFPHEDRSLADLCAFIARAPQGCAAALAGVRPSACRRIADALGGARPLLLAPRDFGAPIENACLPPESVGLDRLFDAAAAALRHGLPAIVVDAGTAVTVDRVDPPGVFRGGAIAPGVRLAFEALERGAEQLPLVQAEPGRVPDALGTDTAAAIRSGVVRGLAGLVDRLVADLAAGLAAAGPPRVVLTGGDAPLLLPLLCCRPRYDADLTLHGIALGARRRARPEAS
ncbi:MAG: type III pantothenate kinase [Planctomycetes bacterium]|nr:type III pantothenate kinase [Planctomycetota bacterium]